MNEQELLKIKMQYEMSVNFFRGLLNNGQLKEKEFKKAVEYAADKYNIETVELELAKLRYPNLQAETSAMKETSIYDSVTGESEIKYISLTDISRNFSDAAPVMLFKAGCVAAIRQSFFIFGSSAITITIMSADMKSYGLNSKLELLL